jgi:hypothetical protein
LGGVHNFFKRGVVADEGYFSAARAVFLEIFYRFIIRIQILPSGIKKLPVKSTKSRQIFFPVRNFVSVQNSGFWMVFGTGRNPDKVQHQAVNR